MRNYAKFYCSTSRTLTSKLFTELVPSTFIISSPLHNLVFASSHLTVLLLLQCWPKKEKQQDKNKTPLLVSEHFPTLHPDSEAAYPFLWDSIWLFKWSFWQKPEDLPVLSKLYRWRMNCVLFSFFFTPLPPPKHYEHTVAAFIYIYLHSAYHHLVSSRCQCSLVFCAMNNLWIMKLYW